MRARAWSGVGKFTKFKLAVTLHYIIIITKTIRFAHLVIIFIYARQVLTQEKGPAQLSQIHGLADLPLPKINLLEVSHEDKGEEAGGSVKNGSILNLQSFSPMNTLPRQQGSHIDCISP